MSDPKPDGSSDTRPVQLWDAATGREIPTLLEECTCGCEGVAFRPDRKRLACWPRLSTVKVWDARVLTQKALSFAEQYRD